MGVGAALLGRDLDHVSLSVCYGKGEGIRVVDILFALCIVQTSGPYGGGQPCGASIKVTELTYSWP
jgi:hypothetical protein